MHGSVTTVYYGALLHDIGKVVHRAGDIDGRAHSISGAELAQQLIKDKDIIDCIRYHHYQDIQYAGLQKDSPAYVVYIADNISSGVDRRKVEGEAVQGFDKDKQLGSIYNLLNNRTGNTVHGVAAIDDQVNYPHPPDTGGGAASSYAKILAGMSDGLRGLEFNDRYINSLLELCEAYLSYVPSSTNIGEVADISLFDHAKITAALASCIVLYLESQGRTDYRAELFDKSRDFYQENAFGLFSFDISGIQQFIYTISSKGALKGLRSRSFYLEILLENMADEILSACSLARPNLLYTGGGHAYLLLPNTPAARQVAREALYNANQRFMEYFGARLFVASGYQECSANELMSKTSDPESYSNIFRSVAAQIAEAKLRRYSPSDLRKLNQTSVDREGRECAVCGVSSDLVVREEGTICRNCAAFTDISNLLIKKDAIFAVLRDKMDAPALPLFSAKGELLHLHVLTVKKVKELLKTDDSKVVRLYSKNNFRTGLSLATKLWLGDFAAQNQAGAIKTFSELAESSAGIKRIGVLRADVDNLGTAFISGFLRETGENKYRYVTISRTTTLSRSMSIFFKYYLNTLLKNGDNRLLPQKKERDIVIVYAGGDDLFLVGAWDEVLSAAINLRNAFHRYTGGALTLSAGLGVFTASYPISRMAAETEQLEKKAKNHEYQGGQKNSLSLFGLEVENGHLTAQHTYDWDTFETKVMGEKYAIIESLFSGKVDYGNTFLYNILYFLRQAEDSINLARLAYLLARREPGRNAPAALKEAYAAFSRNIYQWALEKEDRRQLITALMLYTYSRRDEKEENGNERI